MFFIRKISFFKSKILSQYSNEYSTETGKIEIKYSKGRKKLLIST